MIWAQRATFAEWYDALDAVLRVSPAGPAIPCPNCGVPALRLVFVGNPETRIGYCSFWCENCRYGIRPSRVEIPEGAAMFTFDTPAEQIVAAIADFQEVFPDFEDDDEDDDDGEDRDDGAAADAER